MSNKQLTEVRKEMVRGGASCREFNRVRMNDDMDWKTELGYALEIYRTNERIRRCDPQTITRSLIDLGVMGLTLSPAMKLAYLIPYGKECTASPSYMGLEQVAYRTGMIEGIQCNVVRAKDTFKVFTDRDGRNIQHEEATGDRGEVTHAYCIAWLTSGRTIIEVMDQKALAGCRDAAAKKNGGEIPFVWKGAFREEMYKKSVLRRAWKHFPKMTNPQLAAMMEAVDRTDPMEFDDKIVPVNEMSKVLLGQDELVALRDKMDDAGVPRKAQAATMQGIASSLGFDGIRKVPMTRFHSVEAMLDEGLRQWKERLSASEQSASAQENTTARKEVA